MLFVQFFVQNANACPRAKSTKNGAKCFQVQFFLLFTNTATSILMTSQKAVDLQAKMAKCKLQNGKIIRLEIINHLAM